MKIYHCENCHFTFRREGQVDSCPDCGKPNISPATEQEIEEFKSYINDGWDKK